MILWTAAHQDLLSTAFPGQEYQSGLPCPSPEDHCHPGIKPMSLTSPALKADSLPLAPPRETIAMIITVIYQVLIICHAWY